MRGIEAGDGEDHRNLAPGKLQRALRKRGQDAVRRIANDVDGGIYEIAEVDLALRAES
jgi:hypothetical protein